MISYTSMLLNSLKCLMLHSMLLDSFFTFNYSCKLSSTSSYTGYAKIHIVMCMFFLFCLKKFNHVYYGKLLYKEWDDEVIIERKTQPPSSACRYQFDSFADITTYGL